MTNETCELGVVRTVKYYAIYVDIQEVEYLRGVFLLPNTEVIVYPNLTTKVYLEQE